MSAVRLVQVGAISLVLAFSGATGAIAKPGKKAPQRASSTVSVRTPPPVVGAPARFFTINDVIAKHDGQRRGGSDVTLASAPATATDAPAAGVHALPSDEPFGLVLFRAPEGQLWIKWRAIEAQLRTEAEAVARCRADSRACSAEARRFLMILESAQSRQGQARIEVVNRAVNTAIRYTTDFAQHGVADLWTAPLATLASGRGDCEDYAIAKYVLLREAGVPVEDLRLLLVRDRAVRQDHAVLAVRDGGRWVILDNRNLALAEAQSLPQFLPLFALDHQGVKLVAAPYAARPVAPAGMDQLASSATSSATAPYLM